METSKIIPLFLKPELATQETFQKYGNLFTDVSKEVVRLEQWPKHWNGFRDICDGLGGGATKAHFGLQWMDNFHYASNSGVADGDYRFAFKTSMNHDLSSSGSSSDSNSDADADTDVAQLVKKLDLSSLGNDEAVVIWTEINYHACGSQYFYSSDSDLLLLLAVIPEEERERFPDRVVPSDFRVFLLPAGTGAHIDSYVWHCPPILAKAENGAYDPGIMTSQAKVHSKVYYDPVKENGVVFAVKLNGIR